MTANSRIYGPCFFPPSDDPGRRRSCAGGSVLLSQDVGPHQCPNHQIDRSYKMHGTSRSYANGLLTGDEPRLPERLGHGTKRIVRCP